MVLTTDDPVEGDWVIVVPAENKGDLPIAIRTDIPRVGDLVLVFPIDDMGSQLVAVKPKGSRKGDSCVVIPIDGQPDQCWAISDSSYLNDVADFGPGPDWNISNEVGTDWTKWTIQGIGVKYRMDRPFGDYRETLTFNCNQPINQIKFSWRHTVADIENPNPTSSYVELFIDGVLFTLVEAFTTGHTEEDDYLLVVDWATGTHTLEIHHGTVYDMVTNYSGPQGWQYGTFEIWDLTSDYLPPDDPYVTPS